MFIFGANRFFIWVICQILGLGLLLNLTACGLFKKNASDPYAISLVKKFAAQLEPQPNLSRSSGEVILIRLKTLFPAQVNDGTANFSSTLFSPLSSTGLDRALASTERSSSPVAQMALRARTAYVCGVALPSESAAGAVYSTKDILLAGEVLPADPAVALAFTVARNVWLDIYVADSPEVLELASLYRSELAAGAEANEARKNVCIAAISSPQFWMGNATEGDAIRRVALEVGHRIPKLTEIKDYMDKKLTIRDFVKKIQNDPVWSVGYLGAVKDWHKDWLGLRGLGFRFGTSDGDTARYGWAQINGYSGTGGIPALVYNHSNYAPWGHPGLIPPPAGDTDTYLRTSRSFDGVYQMDSQTYDYSKKNQAFDPRTTMIMWEHKNPLASGAWETVGAWVHKDFISSYLDKATHASMSLCTLQPDAVWYKCDGQITGAAAHTTLDGINLTAMSSDPAHAGKFEYTKGSLVGTPMAVFSIGDRRVRRFSPTGEQDGWSAVKLWYSGQKVFVRNALERFYFACFYRPQAAADARSMGWFGEHWNAAIVAPASGYATPVDTIANPQVLNSTFRCGVPNAAEIKRPEAQYVEDLAYPRGWNADNFALTTSIPGIYNDQATTAALADENMPDIPEFHSTTRLIEDLENEPYNLVERIIAKDLPYTELLTANYTTGREELELFYRSSALFMPVYPDGYSPSAQDDPARNVSRIIDPSKVTPLSRNLIRARSGFLGEAYRPYAQIWPEAEGTIYPARFSGILTMPAFRFPVAPKMRTLASRYFARLMCGDPNLYVPSGEAKALHRKYIPIEANDAVAAHLDEKRGCFSCHLNMDPLASALSVNFAKNVQKDEGAASVGEMGRLATYQWGNQQGQGAVLGHEVSGVREVGQVVAHSHEFAQCVVQTTFKNVFGRPVHFEDASFLLKQTDLFMTHYSYNRLIQDLVDSELYKRRD